MKRNILLIALLAIASSVQAQDLTRFVNLYIGTGGHGHTHPAAMVPHGMVQPGPDTRHHGWDACSGYYYEDRTINGFAQTRLSGTGCADMSDFLLMPLNAVPETWHNGDKGGRYDCSWASSFSHEEEKAEPGYYSVLLRRYDIKAEITATERTALYRFEYNPVRGFKNIQTNAMMLLDLDYTNQNQYLLESNFKRIGDDMLLCYHRTQGWAYNQPVYLAVKFSSPFDLEEIRDTVVEKGRTYPCHKLLLHFRKDADGNEPIHVMAKAAISYCSWDGARRNLEAEQPAWDFEGTRTKAREKWNKCLSKIELNELGEAAADSTREIFYTALYHANIAPNLFSDVDGGFLGMDLKVHYSLEPDYTVFSLWDTHRALHPLISIIDPAANEAYLRSLVRKADHGGIAPKWELTGNYTGCMIGYHYVSLLADMATKGYRNFPLERAFDHAIRCAEWDTTGITPTLPRWKMEEIMPKARYYKNELGYIPCDKAGESVAKGLEYAYDDWCIAQVANLLGKSSKAELYTKRGQFYKNYFDAKTGFVRGKMSDGTWRQNFDPTSSDHRMDDYTEGNAWQWTFFVPHDPQGLVNLFGSKKRFVQKLDSLFTAPSILTGDNVSPDISGLIGQYAHGNEPSHATIFLYNYIDQPWKTQELVDSVLYSLYFDGPMGLSGNEDCGQMSAWYILNALGFYQMCPGKPEYTISRPLFKKATINLPGGKKFVVKTINNSRSNKYVKSIRLNGRQLAKPFFSHAELAAGGTLEIEMTSKRP